MRSVTVGDKTVPTVKVGTVVMVNPSVRQTVSAIRRPSGGNFLTTGQGTDESSSRSSMRQRIGYLYVLLIVVAGFTAEGMHRVTLSLWIDVAGGAAYVLLRHLRWRGSSTWRGVSWSGGDLLLQRSP